MIKRESLEERSKKLLDRIKRSKEKARKRREIVTVVTPVLKGGKDE